MYSSRRLRLYLPNFSPEWAIHLAIPDQRHFLYLSCKKHPNLSCENRFHTPNPRKASRQELLTYPAFAIVSGRRISCCQQIMERPGRFEQGLVQLCMQTIHLDTHSRRRRIS